MRRYVLNGQKHSLGGVFLTTNGGKTWLNTLENESITSVEFAPSNAKIAYAGGQHRFYRSVDGGKKWKVVNGQTRNWGPPDVVSGFPIDILVDPVNPDILFVNNYGGGNVKSTDGGKTWSVASRGYTGALMFDVEVVANNPATVFAGARSGAFRSTDGGSNWEGLSDSNTIFPECYSIAVNPKKPNIIIASVEGLGRVYRSTDNGSAWNKVYQLSVIPGDPDHGFGFKRIAFAPSDSQVIYAGSSRPESRSSNTTALGVFKSTDGGITWHSINTAHTSKFAINNLAVHPSNHNIVYMATSGNGLWKTSDAGASWTKLQGLKATDVRSVVIRPNKPAVIYAGINNGGVFVSTDSGSNWSQMTRGMEPNDPIYALAIDPAQPDVMWAGSNKTGIYRYDTIEQLWVHFNKGLHTRAVTDLAISKDGKVLYATTWGEGVFRLELTPKGAK